MTTFDEPDETLRGGDSFRADAAYARPKDAATLILVRRAGSEAEVLMGRRAAGHAFMPDKWVFPGGRVERADFTAPAAAELRPAVAARLEKTAPPRRARALALAAVRETFEETGLVLGEPSPARPGAGPWREFLSLGALPRLDRLDFIARAITPPYRPRRFDARFFLADASALLSQEPRGDGGELDEIAWFALSETSDLDLPMITRFVLGEVRARLDDPDRPAPFARFVRGKRLLETI